jgi:L-alanine-DL-glutamate epimerase-like enolase superfamily enzyme
VAFTERIELEDGLATVPSTPGLGVAVSVALLEKFTP